MMEWRLTDSSKLYKKWDTVPQCTCVFGDGTIGIIELTSYTHSAINLPCVGNTYNFNYLGC